MSRMNKNLFDMLGKLRYIRVLGKKHDLRELVAITDDNPEDQFEDHVTIVAVWKRMRARLSYDLNRKRDELSELEGERFNQYWITLEDKERAFSDWAVRSYVNADKAVTELKTAITKVRYELDCVDALLDTMEHRKSCLINLCAARRNYQA